MHRDCKRLQCAQNKQTFLSSSSKISGSMKIFFVFFENRWKWLSLYRRKSVHIILSRINALLFANISNEFHDAKTKAKYRLNFKKTYISCHSVSCNTRQRHHMEDPLFFARKSSENSVQVRRNVFLIPRLL